MLKCVEIKESKKHEGGRSLAVLDSVLMSSLTSAMQADELRQQVYANNIANANTPGYKEQTVSFNSLLQARLADLGITTQSAQGPLAMAANSGRDLNIAAGASGVGVSPVVSTVSNTSVSSNGNNVNLDAQMSGMAENQIDYAALVQELNDQFSLLKTAIIGS